MLLLRLLSTALCAAVAALVFALVYAAPPTRVVAIPASPPAFSMTACTLGPPIPSPACERHCAAAVRADRSASEGPINVIDVAPGVTAAQIARLIPLGPREHVAAVNDRVPASDLEAWALIASLPRRAPAASRLRRGELAALDLTVASGTHERRVLVVLH
jgi:hypothetical protein